MVPIVLVNDQHPGAFVHSVMIGNQEGSRDVAEHLVGLGHRRIAYIGDQFGYQSDTERLQATGRLWTQRESRRFPNSRCAATASRKPAMRAMDNCWRSAILPRRSVAITT